MSKFTPPPSDEAAALEKLRREGLPAAVDALIDVASDKKATGQARAGAARTIVDTLGMTKRAADAQAPEIDLSEMTPGQLNAMMAELLAERERVTAALAADEDDIFG